MQIAFLEIGRYYRQELAGWGGAGQATGWQIPDPQVCFPWAGTNLSTRPLHLYPIPSRDPACLTNPEVWKGQAGTKQGLGLCGKCSHQTWEREYPAPGQR